MQRELQQAFDESRQAEDNRVRGGVPRVCQALQTRTQGDLTLAPAPLLCERQDAICQDIADASILLATKTRQQAGEISGSRVQSPVDAQLHGSLEKVLRCDFKASFEDINRSGAVSLLEELSVKRL
jgi:hypothetical protein